MPFVFSLALSPEALIADINTDKQVALNSLGRPAYAAFAESDFFAVDESARGLPSASAAVGEGGKVEPLPASKLSQEL